MQNHKIYFLGLGALGSRYASDFYNYNPNRVKIIVNEERKKRLQKEGVYVNGQKYDFTYVTDNADNDFPDYIFLAVKSLALKQATEDLKPFVGENTMIVSLINGVSSERFLANIFGWNRVINAVVYMNAEREGNIMRHSGSGNLIFGHIDNEFQERLLDLHQLLNEAGIPNEISSNVQKEQWSKYLINVSRNQLSFLLEFDYGEVRSNKYFEKLMYLIAYEVIAVANAKGIELNDEDIKKLDIKNLKGDDSGKSSMLQDREAKRLSETDIFSGEVIRLGNETGINTPYNEFIYIMIKAIEGTYKDINQ